MLRRRPLLLVLGYPEHLVADHAALVAAARTAGFDAEVVAPSRLALAVGFTGLPAAAGDLPSRGPSRRSHPDRSAADAAVVLLDGEPVLPDVVLPRGVNRPWPLLGQLLTVWEAAGVVVLPTPAAIAACADKLVTTRRLVQAGIPVLPSLGVAPGPGVHLGPLVAAGGVVTKPARGSKAAGVVGHPTAAAAADALGQRWPLVAGMVDHQVVQPRATGAGSDLRVVVAAPGSTPEPKVVAVTRRTAPPGGFITNLADSRVVDVADPTATLPAEVAVAERAAAALGLHLAGVDVIEHAGQPVVLEVNAWPGLAAEVRGDELAAILVALAGRVLAARRAAEAASATSR